jgi:hypothetical protein
MRLPPSHLPLTQLQRKPLHLVCIFQQLFFHLLPPYSLHFELHFEYLLTLYTLAPRSSHFAVQGLHHLAAWIAPRLCAPHFIISSITLQHRAFLSVF